MHVAAPGQQRPPEQFGHALAVRRGQHHVRMRADRVDRVGDGYPDLTSIEQAVVVLGIADADRVVPRQAHLSQRLGQAGALGHPGWQDHQLAPVADESAVQAELADHLRGGRLVRGGAGDQHLTGAVRDPSRGQPGAHGAADGGGQQADASRGGQHGAVFRHDRVDMVPGVREHSLQLAHDPPGDHDDPDLPGASLGQRGERVRLDRTVSQGAVVVDRDRPEISRRPRDHVTCPSGS